jgi:uncharacterized membrane protein YgcG
MWGRKRRERELADAREEARRWYERLGGQIMNLPPGDEPATKQALVDAGERYNAAGSQLERATSPAQFQLARETALEGLAYVRAARVAMKLDPGPPLPPLAGQRQAGAIRQDREVEVQGRNYRASANPGATTPYYYPGGMASGRPIPAGWYSEPWWKTALVAGAWGIGGALVFDALLSPSFGDYGYDAGFAAGDQQGYDAGYAAGEQQGYDNADQGADPSADGANYDGGQYDQGGYDSAGYDQGGYDSGGYDSGGFDGGGFDGGGDFGGGDFF